MRVTVKLFASLQAGQFEEQSMEVPEGTAVHGIAALLGIPRSRIGIRLVNGRHAHADQELAAGDSVSLFPPVGGG
jgi:molybdopterin converting factor small subunit